MAIKNIKPALILLTVLVGCSSAGEDLSEPVYTPIQKNEVIQLEGYAGLSSLNHADINVIDVSDYDNPKILLATTTDVNGKFSFELEVSDDISLILFVTSGGSYVDWINFKSVSTIPYQLKSIYHINDIENLDNVFITPMSTLFVSLFDCLNGNSNLNNDPYFYSKSLFQTTFDIDVQSSSDLKLNSLAEDSEDNQKYSTLNFTFSKMSDDFGGVSGIDVLYIFANNLKENCSLLIHDSLMSGSYQFHEESFRQDFLESLQSLENYHLTMDQFDSLNFERFLTGVKSDSGLIFEYASYE